VKTKMGEIHMQRTARAPASPATWALGTSTSLFRELDRDRLRETLESGITHLEIVIPAADPNPSSRQEVVDACRELGLTVHSVHLPFNWEWDPSEPDPELRSQILKKHRAILEEVAAWGPKTAILHPSYEPIAPDERSRRIKACRESLAVLGEAAAALGIRLCVECLPRTCLGNTSAEIATLIDGLDCVSVCCDVNHLVQETPQEFIRAVGQRIDAVHISDYDGQDEKHWPPGRGVIDWDAVIAALAEAGFPGPLMFEVVSRKGEDPVEPRLLSDWWRRKAASFVR